MTEEEVWGQERLVVSTEERERPALERELELELAKVVAARETGLGQYPERVWGLGLASALQERGLAFESGVLQEAEVLQELGWVSALEKTELE